MRPEYTLVLSLIGLGLGVAYAWWVAVRPTLFQADLQAIRAKLDAAMKAEGKTADVSYLLLARDHHADRKVPYLSVPVMALSVRLGGPGRFDLDARLLPDWVVEGARRLTRGEGIHPAVDRAKSDLMIRVISHLALSPGNYLTLLLLLVPGKTKEFASVWSSLRRVFLAIDPPLPVPTRAASSDAPRPLASPLPRDRSTPPDRPRRPRRRARECRRREGRPGVMSREAAGR